MRSLPPLRRRFFPYVLLTGLLLIFGLFGTVFTLLAFGLIASPFGKRPAPAPNYEGLIPVPVSAKPIPAYTMVTRDYLVDPATGSLKVIYVPPEVAAKIPQLVTTTDRILDRVLNHDKPAGFDFTENDFMPTGTRPGLVAGIPPRKRAVDVEADKIQGIQALKAGDHFDLLGSVPLEDRKNSPAALSLTPGLRAPIAKRAWINVLVQDGVIVMPMTTRQVPTGAVSRGVVQTRPVQEVVVAVDPAEMATLTEALDVDARITCVLRSGNPKDPGGDTPTPGSNLPKREVIEIITGGKRQFIEYPVTPETLPPDSIPPVSPPGPAENPTTGETLSLSRKKNGDRQGSSEKATP